MSEMTLTDAIHPDLSVTIYADTFDVHDPRPPYISRTITRRTDADGDPPDPSDNDGPPQPPSDSEPQDSQSQDASSETGDNSDPFDPDSTTPSESSDDSLPSICDLDLANADSISEDQIAASSCSEFLQQSEADDTSATPVNYRTVCSSDKDTLSEDEVNQCFQSWGAQEQRTRRQMAFGWSPNSTHIKIISFLSVPTLHPLTASLGGLSANLRGLQSPCGKTVSFCPL
ncbi:hypothetical protein MVEN_00716100 [Mycena venus]|uniref:Uncharacterized protein n=1 Tax=Mycena venus TaxID=2733690 RepID=A0A8H7D2P6_9AGAR|nr:hypothetical protein MVEN_00716100 [Mycena venus]